MYNHAYNKGKLDTINKYDASIKSALAEANDTRTLLQTQLQQQEQAIVTSFNNFNAQEEQRQKDAVEFCKDKTDEQLKEYLADRPVAYNYWKNADRDTLVTTVVDMYE